MTPAEAKNKTLIFAAEIDEAELALRLMCVALGMKRSETGLSETAREHLRRARREWPAHAGPFPFLDMARIALSYFSECIQKGQQPS